jgi:hypothetical protein
VKRRFDFDPKSKYGLYLVGVDIRIGNHTGGPLTVFLEAPKRGVNIIVGFFALLWAFFSNRKVCVRDGIHGSPSDAQVLGK